MANNGYSSGGSYNSPDKAVETSVRRQLIKDVAQGNASNLQNMNVADIHDPLLNASNSLNQFSKLTQEETTKFEQHVESLINSASSATEAFNAVSAFITKFASQNVNAMKSIQQVRGNDPNNKGEIGVVVSSNEQISIHLQQEILKILQENKNILGEMNKDAKKDRTFQEELFEALGQTITHSFFRSPTVTKIGNLGASLMSAGLFKIASSESAPSWLRQGAMGAVYMEVPQTLMSIIGAVVQTSVSMWMAKTGSQLLGNALKSIVTQAGSAMGGFLGNAGGIITKALPVAVPLILAGAGIFALIKGIIDHRKNMKDKDAQIASDPTLTQGQKDVKRLGAHTASGAKTGAISGALIGAAIGTVIAPGIGTAIGGAIGGAGLGTLIGGAVGSLKPLGAMMKHGLSALGGKIMSGAKWAKDNQDKIMAKVKPILDIVAKVLETAFPFFSIMKLIFGKIANSTWFKGLETAASVLSVLTGGQKDNSNTGTKISTDKSKGGRPADAGLVDLRDAKSQFGVNLKGAIQGAGTTWGNSKPWTRKENLATFAYLDNTLANMGINAVYSSNMGGHHKGGSKSHANGDKVDVVGQSWTPEQYKNMYDRGFFGGKTGALGYEYKIGQTHVTTPEEYARLYKEKGGKMMGGNNHYDLTNKADLISVSSNDSFYDEYNRIKNAVKNGNNTPTTPEPTKKPVMANIKESIKKGVNSFKDITSMDKYTENVTNTVTNVGGVK